MQSLLDYFTTRFIWICVVISLMSQAWAGPPAAGFPQGLTPPQTYPAYMEPDLNSTYSGVPDQLVAPRLLRKPVMKDAFHCERTFLYKGKTYGCDSYVQRDAERLRLFVADVPEANSEIDTYQRNRKNVRTAAYVGSVGLLIAITGFFVSRAFQNPDGSNSQTGIAVRTVTSVTGLGLTIGSVFFGYFSLRNNESHIDRAVSLHNEAHPTTPIVLQFSKGFSL
jgi:hypothetical protein